MSEDERHLMDAIVAARHGVDAVPKRDVTDTLKDMTNEELILVGLYRLMMHVGRDELDAGWCTHILQEMDSRITEIQRRQP